MAFFSIHCLSQAPTQVTVLFSLLSHIYSQCVFVCLFFFIIGCLLLCQCFFFLGSSICSCSFKIDGHLSLVRAATQMVPPANHPVPPAKVYSYWKQCLWSFTELIQSACRGLGISVSSSSAAGPFGGQGAVCASVHKGCLTLALSLGFSLACCLQTSGPTACVQNSGWILDTFPFWRLHSPSLESVCATTVDLAVRPRHFHGDGKAFLF